MSRDPWDVLSDGDCNPWTVVEGLPADIRCVYFPRAAPPRKRRLLLTAAELGEPRRPDNLTDTQWQWLHAASHRGWPAFAKTFTDRPNDVLLDLVANNCVVAICEFPTQDLRRLPPVQNVVAHPDLRTAMAGEKRARRDELHAVAHRGVELAVELRADLPGVATALDRLAAEPRLSQWQNLRWMVWAAEDLAAGRRHDGPRAFVQSKVGDTKARENLDSSLLAAGWERDAVDALGILRLSYIGLSGPMWFERGGELPRWPGPHDIRLPAEGGLIAGTDARILLVVENRQAAERAADRWPEHALVWCHGQHSDDLLTVVAGLAQAAEHVVVCPDADVGGVYIADRVAGCLPERIRPDILDVGAVAGHVRGGAFNDDETARLDTLADGATPGSILAAACRERGYRVEQESSAYAALRAALEAR